MVPASGYFRQKSNGDMITKRMRGSTDSEQRERERERERDERSNFVREWRSSFEGSVNRCARVDLAEASIR